MVSTWNQGSWTCNGQHRISVIQHISKQGVRMYALATQSESQKASHFKHVQIMRDFDICESTHNLNTNGVISLERVQKETNSINEIHLFDHWIELPWTWAVPDFPKSCDSVTLTSLSNQCKPWSPLKLPWAKWKLFCPRYHKLFGNILILYNVKETCWCWTTSTNRSSAKQDKGPSFRSFWAASCRSLTCASAEMDTEVLRPLGTTTSICMVSIWQTPSTSARSVGVAIKQIMN